MLSEETIHEIKKDISNLYKILHGNGEHGLTTKVALNSEALQKIMKLQELDKSTTIRRVEKFFEVLFKCFITAGMGILLYKMGIN